MEGEGGELAEFGSWGNNTGHRGSFVYRMSRNE